MALTDIITRKYTYFSGVDFSNSEKKPYRSPDMKNMYKNYKESSNNAIETRFGMSKIGNLSYQIYGIFFYTYNNVEQVLVHAGTKLYKFVQNGTSVLLYEGLNPNYSRAFIFDNIFFLMDGINYLEYNGVTCSPVEGIIPITTYERTPHAQTHIDDGLDSDLVYQPVNLLTPKRKNLFIADGESTDYYLDDTNLDSKTTYAMVATIEDNGTTSTLNEDINFSVNRTTGVVTFNSAPSEGARVTITYSKTISGYKARILNSKISCEFDNRIFVAGNPDYPNAVFHSEYNEPRYFSDLGDTECGVDLSLVKAMIPASNSLYVIKEKDNNQSSLIILTPAYTTINGADSKTYPATNASVSLGCVSTGINFRDDLVYFSRNGLEAITGSVYNEQILTHRSSNVDAKMVNETGYKNVKLCEWKNYLLCLINSKVYLADANAIHENDYGKNEYEWFYWELPNNISYIKEYKDNLYYGNASGDIYLANESITKDGEADIASYIVTYKDNCGYDGYTKTTNKKGAEIDLKTMSNDAINVNAITNTKNVLVGTYSDSNGHIVLKKKMKKFKEIQFKISSNKPFGIYSMVFEAFIAGYLKK